MPPKIAHKAKAAARKPALPKQSHEKPVVVDTHAQAASAVRSGARHVLVHKALLSHYANLLTEHKKLGAKIPQNVIDGLRKYATGKDSHAQIGGNWFTSAFHHVTHALGTAARAVGNGVVTAGRFVAANAPQILATGQKIYNTVAPLVKAAAPLLAAAAA